MTHETKAAPRIVIGVDGSKESKLALRWAERMATFSGATLEAVTAWDLTPTYGWSNYPSEWNPQGDAQKMLQATVDEVFAQDRPTDLSLTVQEGSPARVLLQRGKGALMIVTGSRGHGGFSGMLLGSVSANVAEHAHCPVLVVHGDELLPVAVAS